MTLLDANIPLYAYDADAPQQPAAADWLTKIFETPETIALTWPTIWAFIRIATNPKTRRKPLTTQRAIQIVNGWLSMSGVVVLQPGPRHLEILEQIATNAKMLGPSLTDAVLAAIAIENGSVLASTDQGFGRFRGLRWVNPLAKPNA